MDAQVDAQQVTGARGKGARGVALSTGRGGRVGRWGCGSPALLKISNLACDGSGVLMVVGRRMVRCRRAGE